MTKHCGRDQYGLCCSTCGELLPDHYEPLNGLIAYCGKQEYECEGIGAYKPGLGFEAMNATTSETRDRISAKWRSWRMQLEQIQAKQLAKPVGAEDVSKIPFRKMFG